MLLGLTTMVMVTPIAMLQKVFGPNREGQPRILGNFMMWVACKVWGLSVSVHGNLALIADDHTPCVYVCNHQSMLDLVRGWDMGCASMYAAGYVICICMTSFADRCRTFLTLTRFH